MSTDTVGEPSVLDVMDELEDLINSARRVPLSANVIVNEDEALELIDRLRVRFPEELTQARHMLDDRERIVDTAREEAEQILARAEQESERLLREAGERAATLVADHAVTQQAQAHGAQLLADAEARAAETRAEADAYTRDVMTQLEEQLTRTVATVRKGIETLPAPSGSRRRRREGKTG